MNIKTFTKSVAVMFYLVIIVSAAICGIAAIFQTDPLYLGLCSIIVGIIAGVMISRRYFQASGLEILWFIFAFIIFSGIFPAIANAVMLKSFNGFLGVQFGVGAIIFFNYCIGILISYLLNIIIINPISKIWKKARIRIRVKKQSRQQSTSQQPPAPASAAPKP